MARLLQLTREEPPDEIAVPVNPVEPAREPAGEVSVAVDVNLRFAEGPTQMDDTIHNRRGRMRITTEMFDTHADIIQLLHCRMIVTRCEHRWDRHAFEYSFLSMDIPEVPREVEAPSYSVTVNRSEDNTITFAFRRVEG